MKTQHRRALLALIVPVVLAALFATVNLPVFDQSLRPELTALRSIPDIPLKDNSYVLAMGFLAHPEKDPQRAGEEIIEALRYRFRNGASATLSSDDWRVILESAEIEEAWREDFPSLECNARVYLNCADQLIEEVASYDLRSPRLDLLLERYDALLDQPTFEENEHRDVTTTPHPPYGVIRNVGRIGLAIRYERGSVESFLDASAEGLQFWRTALSDGATLPTKLVAIAGIQDHLDFLSALMRDQALDQKQLSILRGFVRPLSDSERDIGEAFVSEARIALYSDPHPMLYGASWLIRLSAQENATRNEEYRTVFEPMMYRASLTADQFYRKEAYRPMPYRIDLFPPPIYNLGGKLARRSVWPDPEQYISRVHDQNGRISLVLLQAEIEGAPEESINDTLRSSIYTNPYTSEPMTYDATRQTIGFECLHTAYHPPALPDDCSVLIAH
jgi:hypothetical protein